MTKPGSSSQFERLRQAGEKRQAAMKAAELEASSSPELANSGTPESGTPNSGPPDIGTPNAGTPDLNVPDLFVLDLDVPDLGILRSRRAPRPRLASRAQDGHSHAEQALYQALWSHGAPVPGTENRRITAGSRTIAGLASVAHSTCQANLKSLEAKLAIHCEGKRAQHTDGKTYLIYSYGAIMQRRAAAGLTHVLRTTKGVRLTGPDVPDLDVPDLDVPDLDVPNAGTPDFKSGTPNAGTLSKGTLNKQVNTESLSSEITVLSGVLAREGAPLDDDAVRKLIAGCRAFDPTATVEEIAHFTLAKHRERRGRATTGLLLRAVPKYFEGEAALVQEYRGRQQQPESPPETYEQDLAEYEREFGDKGEGP